MENICGKCQVEEPKLGEKIVYKVFRILKNGAMASLYGMGNECCEYKVGEWTLHKPGYGRLFVYPCIETAIKDQYLSLIYGVSAMRGGVNSAKLYASKVETLFGNIMYDRINFWAGVMFADKLMPLYEIKLLSYDESTRIATVQNMNDNKTQTIKL